MLEPFLFLVEAFVQTFGITKPTPDGKRRAARVLAWLLPLLAAVLVAAAVLIDRALLHGR